MPCQTSVSATSAPGIVFWVPNIVVPLVRKRSDRAYPSPLSMNAVTRQTIVALSRYCASLIAMLASLGGTVLIGETSHEYETKASFLYNFITFTEWPAKTFSTAKSPYVIGVLGEDPFGSTLDHVLNGGHIKSRPLVVRRFKRIEDMHRVHILFLSESEAYHMAEILRSLRREPVLTVSDIPGFAEAGGAIGFISGTPVKLLVNPVALNDAKLSVSSKLLQLAQLVPNVRSP